MIYIIDHQDSFTWNVVHQFSMFDEVYCSNYFEINQKKINESKKIVQQRKIYHGFQSKIKVTKESKLFKKNKTFEVGRYHSLRLDEPFNSKNIKITMRCFKTNIAMGIEDHKNNVFGFQFHPESFLTKNGKILIKKILST